MNDASIAHTFPNKSDPQIIYTYAVLVLCIMRPIRLLFTWMAYTIQCG